MKGQGIVAGDTTSPGIIYNNIKDTTLPFVAKATSSCDLDIDNDNVNDIRFSHEHNSTVCSYQVIKTVSSLSGLEFALTSSNIYADTMAIDSVIDNSLNWKNVITGNRLKYGYSVYCPPPPISFNAGDFIYKNNYLGFRKVTTSDTIYGWFLLDMTGTIKIKSYAYQTNNQSGVGIRNLTSAKVVLNLYPNPVGSLLNISAGGNRNSEIEISNYLGQPVLKTEYVNAIDVSKFTDGIYTLKLITKDNQYYYSKFVKE